MQAILMGLVGMDFIIPITKDITKIYILLTKRQLFQLLFPMTIIITHFIHAPVLNTKQHQCAQEEEPVIIVYNFISL
jgi:hypothetical protein